MNHGNVEAQVLMLQTPTAALAGGVQTLETQVGGRPKYKTLQTPTVSDTNGPGTHGEGGLDLRTAISMLPTPVTQPETGNGHARNLSKEVKMLQTPSVADALGGHERRGGKRSAELLLNGQVKELAKLLPTPVAQPSGNKPEEHLRKKPGREVVTDLAIITENNLLSTGGRMNPPSGDGNKQLDGMPRDQPSLLDAMAEND
jgi:hypothetical protein